MAVPAGAARGRIPWAVRTTALAGLALTAAYAVLYLVARDVDPRAAASMLRMYGLTIAAGRETAMFDALHRGLPAPWVYGLSVIDDIGSLLLALPFAWFAMRFLKRFHRVRWALARFEKQALQHRRWVQRWGLGGLALFYFLPGFGAGVPITVLLGVLARIPFGTLVPFFVAATLLVDGVWALTLTGAERLLPDAPWVDAVPLVVVGLVLASAAAGAWRGRAQRHVALLDWPIAPSPGEAARLARAGVAPAAGLVRADLDALSAALGGRERRMGRLLAVAELLLLDGMAQDQALALVESGIAGLQDVAGGDPDALARKAEAARVPWTDGHGPAWVAQARRLVEAQSSGWSRIPSAQARA